MSRSGFDNSELHRDHGGIWSSKLLMINRAEPAMEKVRFLQVLLTVLISLRCQQVMAGIDESGLCALYTFVPFTDNGTSSGLFLHYRGNNTSSSSSSNFGFDHMAAALLAMEHFNERNTLVVPELANYIDCPIYFDMNQSRFFDTGTRTHQAAQTLAEQPRIPCAIAGAFHDMASLDLGAQAMAEEYAHVVYQAYNLRISSDRFAPFTSQVYPSMDQLASRTVDYILSWNRTNFTAIVYPTTDLGLQQRELLSIELEQRRMMYQSVGYADPDAIFGTESAFDIGTAMRMVKERGYRTIILAVDDSKREIPEIAQAAEDAKLNNGDHFWVWFGPMDPKLLNDGDPLVVKLLYGSAWVNAIELFVFRSYYNLTDPFAKAMGSVASDFINQLNVMNPIPPDAPGYVYASPNFFTTQYRVELGSGFMYDSVMSIGLGACAAQQKVGLPVSGAAHRHGIRHSNFTGASGHVEFSDDRSDVDVRNGTTISWGALNILPASKVETEGQPFTVAAIMPAAKQLSDQWVPVADFTFADGTSSPPALLRDMPNQNYINAGLRGLALVLVATVYLFAIGTAAWVYWHRSHRVVKAAQPMFLYILAFGAAVLGSTIVCFLNDESYGWTQVELSRACTSVPWLITFGFMFQYLALFSKLWRVQRVLQFSRREIKLWHVLWPSALLVLVAIAILTCWTFLDPPVWIRVELDPISGDSIGRCEMNDMRPYAIPLALLIMIPALLTGYMAWKTKDVDDAYTESWWIFILFCVQLEIVIVGAPLVAILRDVSTNGKIMGYTILFWILPVTALSLIMVPKYLAYWRAKHNVAMVSKTRGRQGGNVYVSGLETTATTGPNFADAENKDSLQHSSVADDKQGHHGHNDIGIALELDSPKAPVN